MPAASTRRVNPAHIAVAIGAAIGLALLFRGAGDCVNFTYTDATAGRRARSLPLILLGSGILIAAAAALPRSKPAWTVPAVLAPGAACLLARLAWGDSTLGPALAWFLLTPVAAAGLLRALRR